MKIISNTLDFELNMDTAVALGKFDGLHLGHRKLLGEILEKKTEGLAACVLTFDPSPAVYFGFSDGREITTKEEKRALLEALGVDVLVEFPMNRETASMDPEIFIREILVKRMHTKWIAAGSDVTFGDKGAGNEALLRSLSDQLSYGVTTIDKLKVNGTEISSSYIRSLLEQGRMEQVEAMMGAPYSVSGVVEHGKKLGRRLGMPTVNLLPPKDKLLPPKGVYFSKAQVGEKLYDAISNIGYKPTVSQEKVIGLETYLYDFDQNIYGEQITVYLESFKRAEMRFPDVEELKKQMERDIADGKTYHLSKKG